MDEFYNECSQKLNDSPTVDTANELISAVLAEIPNVYLSKAFSQATSLVAAIFELHNPSPEMLPCFQVLQSQIVATLEFMEKMLSEQVRFPEKSLPSPNYWAEE